MASLVGSTKHLKKEVIPILYPVFQIIEELGILPNSFHKANITLMPKP